VVILHITTLDVLPSLSNSYRLLDNTGVAAFYQMEQGKLLRSIRWNKEYTNTKAWLRGVYAAHKSTNHL